MLCGTVEAAKMGAQLIVNPPSSILFSVTGPFRKFGNLWNAEKKQCAMPLTLQRPHQLFTTDVVNNKNNNDKHVGSIILKSRLWASAVPQAGSRQSKSIVASYNLRLSLQRNLGVFCRFARLNVILATALCVISMSILTIEKMSDISPLFLTRMLSVNVAAAFMNIYVVGLNQLCDIEIDKVNKPKRPLASSEYSVKTGALIVVSAAVLGLSIPIFLGSWPLFWAIFLGSLLLGFAYSVDLPLLRWKRSPLLTAICLVVNKSASQIGYYLHMQTHVLGRPAVLSKPLIFTVAITGLFAVVFGLFKDIPDVAGDKLDGVQSLAILLGEQRVFMICVTLLEVAYLTAMLVGATCSNAWSKYLTVTGHAAMALILWNRARSFDYSGPAAYESFYSFIWKLYCAEYVLVHFVR